MKNQHKFDQIITLKTLGSYRLIAEIGPKSFQSKYRELPLHGTFHYKVS